MPAQLNIDSLNYSLKLKNNTTKQEKSQYNYNKARKKSIYIYNKAGKKSNNNYNKAGKVDIQLK